MAQLPSGTVTFLFTDIEGSTRLLEEFPQAQSAALLRHGVLLRAAIDLHQGAVFETIGDGYYAVFDRPGDAVAAAVRAQLDLQAEPWGEVGHLNVRMALHTGAVEQRGERYYGPPLYRCARLLALAHGGQVLLSAATAQLVRGALPPDTTLRPLGTHRLRDLAAPEEVLQLVHPELPADFPPLRSIDSLPTNLPVQVTSFVGRGPEMAELTRLLGRTRILSLTGAGGVGKTRLAIQTAAEIVDRYPDGVWLVELAPLSDAALVIPEIASNLGVHEQHGRPLLDSLGEHLRPRRALLVLDNCEHLIDCCAELVDTLVRACPQLQILATSREALGIEGETDWRVPSLALPDLAHLPPLERLSRCEAVQLFVERATAALPSFRLTEQNALAVAQICARLDGIPLAIELAAARVKVLAAEQIATRLDNVFRLLTAGSRTALPRQQTLRAMVDWSYDLLGEPERRLFNRLSVFAGGWTLEAAEAICGDAIADVFDLLAHLVDKSLVLAEERGPAVRYRLLEPIRQYGVEKLHECGEDAAVRQRHVDWFVRFAVQAEERLRGPELSRWLDRVEEEYDNLCAALEWSGSREDSADAELTLCSALLWFWWERERVPEGRERVERALARSVQAPVARIGALATAAWLAHFHRDQGTARARISEGLVLARSVGDQQAEAWALHLLGRTHYFEGDAVTARALGEESLATAQAVGDPYLVAWAIHLLGLAAYVTGDFATARRHLEESLAIRRQIGHEVGIQILYNLLALVAHREGDLRAAAALHQEILQVGRAKGIGNSVHHALAGLSALAAECDQPERAVSLAAAASRHSEIVGTLPIPISEALLAEGLERARNALDEETYAVAWSRGLAMSEDEGIDDALELAAAFVQESAAVPQPRWSSDEPAGRPRQVRPDAHPLTTREVEVLRLLVDGQTSKEIAAALVISVPTVERHITHIYAKIGARRRTDAAAYALKHQLL